VNSFANYISVIDATVQASTVYTGPDISNDIENVDVSTLVQSGHSDGPGRYGSGNAAYTGTATDDELLGNTATVSVVRVFGTKVCLI
jgi:hypothetical protein